MQLGSFRLQVLTDVECPVSEIALDILCLYCSVGMTASEGRLFQVDVIVLDEVHYLSDISRGTVWEETVCYCITHINHVCSCYSFDLAICIIS